GRNRVQFGLGFPAPIGGWTLALPSIQFWKKAEKADKNPKSVALQEEERLPHISLGGGVTVHYHVAPMVSVPDGAVDLIGGVALAPASNGCTSDSKLMSLIHTAYNRHCLKCGDEPN